MKLLPLLVPIGGVNTFTDDYTRDEIAFYGLDSDVDPGDGVRITMIEPRGPCDDYLNVQFRVGGLHCPAFTIDGRIWMGLTPMETQSHHLPIHFATGIAATVGLGMGHFALRVAAKEDVERLDVYEQDPRVIALFNRLFAERDGFDKIRIIEGDARVTLPKCGTVYDTLYVDLYPTLCSDDVITDIPLFAPFVDAGGYSFWGRELVLLNALYEEVADGDEIDWPTRCFLALWEITSELRHRPLYDTDYIERVIEALREEGQMG